MKAEKKWMCEVGLEAIRLRFSSEEACIEAMKSFIETSEAEEFTQREEDECWEAEEVWHSDDFEVARFTNEIDVTRKGR